MNRKILVFNIVFNVVTLWLFLLGDRDSSASLGYGFFIGFFWLIAVVVLVILLVRGVIRPRGWLDKLGIFTATPVLALIFISIRAENSGYGSTWYFDKGGYRYKEVTMDRSSGARRIEYYRSAKRVDSARQEVHDWVRDSAWVTLSANRDTVERVVYRDGVEVGR